MLFQYKDSCNKFKLNVIGNSNKDWRGYVTLAEPVDYEVQPFYQIPIAAFVSTFEIKRNWKKNEKMTLLYRYQYILLQLLEL